MHQSRHLLKTLAAGSSSSHKLAASRALVSAGHRRHYAEGVTASTPEQQSLKVDVPEVCTLCGAIRSVTKDRSRARVGFGLIPFSL